MILQVLVTSFHLQTVCPRLSTFQLLISTSTVFIKPFSFSLTVAWPVYLMLTAKEGFTIMQVKDQGETYSVIVQALLPSFPSLRRCRVMASSAKGRHQV